MLGNAASLCNALLTVVFNFVKKFKTNHGPHEYNKNGARRRIYFDSTAL